MFEDLLWSIVGGHQRMVTLDEFRERRRWQRECFQINMITFLSVTWFQCARGFVIPRGLVKIHFLRHNGFSFMCARVSIFLCFAFSLVNTFELDSNFIVNEHGEWWKNEIYLLRWKFHNDKMLCWNLSDWVTFFVEIKNA